MIGHYVIIKMINTLTVKTLGKCSLYNVFKSVEQRKVCAYPMILPMWNLWLEHEDRETIVVLVHQAEWAGFGHA